MYVLPEESITPPLKHVSQIHNVSPADNGEETRQQGKLPISGTENQGLAYVTYPFIGGTSSHTRGTASLSLHICSKASPVQI